jgi:hypothetical protein
VSVEILWRKLSIEMIIRKLERSKSRTNIAILTRNHITEAKSLRTRMIELGEPHMKNSETVDFRAQLRSSGIKKALPKGRAF